MKAQFSIVARLTGSELPPIDMRLLATRKAFILMMARLDCETRSMDVSLLPSKAMAPMDVMPLAEGMAKLVSDVHAMQN